MPPEQVDGDFIIDLFSSDSSIAGKSVALLNRVFDKAVRIGRLINNQECVKVMVNCGGHTKNAFLDAVSVEAAMPLLKYKRPFSPITASM